MADIRINALATTATTPASDDYLALDGTAQGTRKILATNIANNVTDVILGTSGPSVKSSLSARAPRQGLVFDSSAHGGAPIANQPAFGTSDFTVTAWVNPVSVASNVYILASVADSASLFFTANTVQWIANASAVISVAGGVVAGKSQLFVVTRSAGTTTYYYNGVAVSTTSSGSGNLANPIVKMGSSASGASGHFNGTISALIYNRALSASEVVALYEAGAPSASDYASGGANNTSYITGANSTFSSDTGFWTKAFSASIGSGQCTLPSGGGVIYVNGLLVKGTKYRLSVNIITNDTSGLYVQNMNDVGYGYILGTGVKTFEFTASGSGAANFGLQNQPGVASIVIDDVTLVPIGLLLAPDAAQAGGGLTWYDTSGNAANITLPASGVSWNVPFGNNIAASGTNQNLTLNASGTGSILLGSNGVARGQIAGVNKNGSTGPASSGTTTNGIWRVSNVSNSLVLDVGLQGNASPYPGYIQVSDYSNLATSYPLSLNPNGGNVLIGTTTDGGQKLQVGGAVMATGSGEFGAGQLELKGSANAIKTFYINRYGVASGSQHFIRATATPSLEIVTANSESIVLSPNGTTALTLDSSQNATFAGRVISNGTGYGVGANSDANTPFNALTSINGTFGALIKNTNAGSSAFAGINIEADSGQAGFRQYSTAHSVWAGKTLISAPSGGTGLVLLTNGAGDAIDLWTNATQALSIDASQNIVPGTAALATTATNGFIYLQTCAGAPTGVPTTYTGRVASIYDTTNNKLYIYNGGWKSVTLA